MSVHPIRLTAEYGGVALGLGAPRPRLSWHLDATPGDTQRGYRITARGDGPPLDSGPGDSRESTWIPWPFPPLSSRQRLEVQVGAWGRAGPRETAWSEPLALEAGLLLPGDWHVPMVVADPLRPDDDGPRPAFLARAEFAAPDQVHRARLYMTAHGVYTAEVNGSPASDDVLDPGWTSYRHRVIARTYDIGHLVRPGLNAIGIWLADGWYRGRLGFSGGVRDVYGKALAFLAQVEITTPDGLVLATGPQTPWRVTPSPIVAAGLYEGETYDARLECPGWSLPGFDDISWREAQQEPNNAIVRTVVPPTLAPIRVIETIEPRTREVQPSGRIRFDFGQNLSGRLTATVRTADGGVVRLHHAEALENGDLATRPLRAATSVDSLILAGNGVRRHTPRFTLHGFRYAEAETSTPAIAVEEVKAEVIHTDMDRTGWFACSNEMLNRLHENVVWSMRANFASLPTDCPQRDERLGWTGDIQVFAPTALYLYDCAGLLVNWLADLAAEQREFATVPNFVPWIECGFPDDPAAAWGDAAVIVPWTLYQRTGDLGVLAAQFDSMAAWVRQVHDLTGGTGLWNTGFQLGDWLDPEAPPEAPDLSRTDRYLVATAYHARTAGVVAEVARLLGQDDAAGQFAQIARRAVQAFRTEWISPSGRLVSDTQTALALALGFTLLDTPAQFATARRRLVELVRECDHRIGTGFVGTPLVADALADAGAMDDAYHLLLQERCPSWLYPVTMGATTIWERWDSMLPNGEVNPGEMTSFNHYAFGAVADFLHRRVAGLAPLAPGYREVLIAPHPGGGLTDASTRHITPYGPLDVSWSRHGETLEVAAHIPAGVTARVRLPGSEGEVCGIGHGDHRFTGPTRPADRDPRPARRINRHNPAEAAARSA